MAVNINYDKLMNECLEKARSKERAEILLHVCCAPCLSGCIARLSPYANIHLFWYNPNITDRQEHDLRLDELKGYLRVLKGQGFGDLPLYVDQYAEQEYLSRVTGHEQDKEGGERCALCFALRLDRCAVMQKTLGLDGFTTTLSISPYKNSALLNQIGAEVATKHNATWIYSDFAKGQGYEKSIAESKKYSLYRQNYCGCEFSKR